MLITLPLVLPVIQKLGQTMMPGVRPRWWRCGGASSTSCIIELGMIIPPIGIIVFILHGLAPQIPIRTIYRGVDAVHRRGPRAARPADAVSGYFAVAAAGAAELTQPGLRLRGPLAQRSGKSGRAPIVDLAGDPARQRQAGRGSVAAPPPWSAPTRSRSSKCSPSRRSPRIGDRDAGCLGIDLTILQCIALVRGSS